MTCLAYQVFGDGEIELVFAGSFVSHVELFWTVPEAIWSWARGSVSRTAERELKGVPGQWHLLAVDPEGARPGSREATLATTPTPSTTTR